MMVQASPDTCKQELPRAQRLTNRKLQLGIIVLILVAIASGVSHFLANWLEIETTTGQAQRQGDPALKQEAFLAGSSLSGYGISWEQVSDVLNNTIVSWGVAGSSPWEWEPFQGRAPDAKLSFIVVSAYDLNEQFLCDFHADVVPMRSTLRDLWRSGVDWQFSKRVLSQYPLKYVRMLFPTVGRSQGVMTGLRDKLSAWRGGKRAESRPTMSVGKDKAFEPKTERLSTWSMAKTLRRLALMRNACQGRHSFNGPKKLAFVRTLQQASKQGQAVVVVLPVSPLYHQEFLRPDLAGQFEQALSDVRRQAPQAQWIRLDHLPVFNSNEYYCDFVHINFFGQQIATEALLAHLKGRLAAL